MNKHICSLVCIGLALPYLMFGQFNEGEAKKLNMRINLSGQLQSGNVNFFSLTGKLGILAKIDKSNVFKTQSSITYQYINNNRSGSVFSSRNVFYNKPKNTFYPFVVGQVSSNYKRKIDFRYFLGGGIGMHIIKSKQNNLRFALGSVYENTRFDEYVIVNNTMKKRVKVWRANFSISGDHKWFNKKIHAFYNVYLQEGLNDFSNLRIHTEIGVEFLIYKGLAFTINNTYNRENLIVNTFETDDNNFEVGLRYSIIETN